MSERIDKWFDDRIEAYVDGELPDNELRMFEARMAHDPARVVRSGEQILYRTDIAGPAGYVATRGNFVYFTVPADGRVLRRHVLAGAYGRAAQ